MIVQLPDYKESSSHVRGSFRQKTAKCDCINGTIIDTPEQNVLVGHLTPGLLKVSVSGCDDCTEPNGFIHRYQLVSQ